MQYHAIPCNTMQYPAIPCNTMQCNVIPCNILQYHAIPCNTMQYHAITCNTMQYYAIQCNTMQYHASLINADGAYHCPVGSIMAIFIYTFLQRRIHFLVFLVFFSHMLSKSFIKTKRFDFFFLNIQRSSLKSA